MEHKKFFVKDFIHYCSPCFVCGYTMTFKFGFNGNGQDALFPDCTWANTAMTIVTDKYTVVDLSIRYRANLKIYIYHRNNKLVTSDNVSFSDYLAKRKLFLICYCVGCDSSISSRNLDFQTFNGVVSPTTIRYENFLISHKNRRYQLRSDFDKQKSIGTVRTYTAPNVSGPDLVFEMKLLPKYKLGNKQKLIDKLNTYALFS